MGEFRGFRYQTGEIKELAEAVLKDGHSKADIDHISELDIYYNELSLYNIYKIKDIELLYMLDEYIEDDEFYARVYFSKDINASSDSEDKLYIDFFLITEEEKSYDEIFWG